MKTGDKYNAVATERRMCRFKIRGGGKLVVPIDRIDYVIIDEENLQSKVYVLGKSAPVVSSERPEDILKELGYRGNNEPI